MLIALTIAWLAILIACLLIFLSLNPRRARLQAFRQIHFFITPREANAMMDVNAGIAQQMAREELEKLRNSYKESTYRLINLSMGWRRSRKVVIVHVELDDELFKGLDSDPMVSLSTIASAVTEKIKAEWERRKK